VRSQQQVPAALYPCERRYSYYRRLGGPHSRSGRGGGRRIFGPRMDEVTGEWRRLHNEELNDLYTLPNIARVIKWRRMRWAWHVARMGEERGVYRVLVGKPEERRPLGRPRRR